mmetsp:Transcript_15781/g.34159  ORF Transcript_15781/g.34159 Transcript_15781/m.34159 type:complete len:222 (-) Transcript_15781:1319-1984(-)
MQPSSNCFFSVHDHSPVASIIFLFFNSGRRFAAGFFFLLFPLALSADTPLLASWTSRLCSLSNRSFSAGRCFRNFWACDLSWPLFLEGIQLATTLQFPQPCKIQPFSNCRFSMSVQVPEPGVSFTSTTAFPFLARGAHLVTLGIFLGASRSNAFGFFFSFGFNGGAHLVTCAIFLGASCSNAFGFFFGFGFGFDGGEHLVIWAVGASSSNAFGSGFETLFS